MASVAFATYRSQTSVSARLHPPSPGTVVLPAAQWSAVGGAAGYAMAALLVALSVLSIVASVALPVWQTVLRREREAELIFRGEQYVQAIALDQRKVARRHESGRGREVRSETVVSAKLE